MNLVVVGSYNVGLTIISPRLPAPGETVLGHTFDLGPGGKGSNQAIGAHRLGAPVQFVTKLGSDAFGDRARELFDREGLMSPGILEADTHTGVGLVLVDDDAENMISVAPGANALLIGEDLDTVEGLFAEGGGYLLCQLESPVSLFAAAARRARAAGYRTILNPAPAHRLDADTLALVDYLTPNQHELAAVAGVEDTGPGHIEPTARRLLAAGVGEVIVTLGAEGALRVGPGGTVHYPPRTVEAVDTTGAGDAFNAALAAGLVAGLGIDEAIALGIRAGAFCVTRVGVIDGLATMTQLDEEVPA